MMSGSQVVGKGSADLVLTAGDIREIAETALDKVSFKRKILAIIPDTTRDDNTHILFPFIDEIVRSKGITTFKVLVAQGTHPPITGREKLNKIGLKYFKDSIFDHEWNNPEQLTQIGRLDAEEVSAATDGSFDKDIDLTINRLVLDHDLILVIGATTPHEVVGFSGGAKYFFPGISGADLTNATHWIGALAGIENVIGRVETPTRHLIEKAADRIDAEIINFSSAVSRDRENRLQTNALFAGDFRASFRRAAEVSLKVNVRYVDRTYKRVLAILDTHYNELWTGGKASYKLGGIIEEGGELLVYAPHLNEISKTHCANIEKYGYAPIEKIKGLVATSEELQSNLCVAAHLAHVSYCATANDPQKPKYKIIMASGLSRSLCERINLGFADHHAIDTKALANDPDTLVVENAGRDLFLIR